MYMIGKLHRGTGLIVALLVLPASAYGIQVAPDISADPVPVYAFQPAADPAPAADAAPAAAPDADGNVAVTATIVAVKGNVGVQASEEAPLMPAAVGMKLEQGAIIHTGLRSMVQFLIGKDETITLDRISVITLLQAVQNKGKATTDLGLKYGRVRYDIQKTDLKHDSKVRSPGSTLAIRGTDVTYEDQAPWVPTAISRNGRAEFRNYRRQFVAFGGKQRAAVAGDKQGPAEQAVSTTKNDPRGNFAGRTAAEEELNVTAQPLGGADAKFQRGVQDLLRGFTNNPNVSGIGFGTVPGPLEFGLGWNSLSGNFGPANVDLIVTDPKGQVLSASNPLVGSVQEKGVHSGDDRGASGIGGETATWSDFFPAGKFTVRAVNQGGNDAQVTLTASLGLAPNLKQTTLTPVEPKPPVVLKSGESYTATYKPSAKSSGGGAAKSKATTNAAQNASPANKSSGRR